MPISLKKAANLVRNMGWRYVSFRLRYEVLRRSGLLKNKFPTKPVFKQYLTLGAWKKQSAQFFFANKEGLNIARNPTPELKEAFTNIQNGKLLLFNSTPADLGKDHDWVTNADSGFKYDIHKHWTEIADYSKEAGDIKYVWEKSRFSYLYTIIRYDYHFGEDCAEVVFRDIMSWINSNPVNCGPNYRCSQEMSLRVLNWTFALYYYRDSAALTDEVFNQMQHAIYWHLHHIYNNINFSRIAVRNNHAITETLMLYLAGIFYPTLPGADEWKRKGKAWFEAEIGYQVYEDGTFLQFSMNYHRVVVQLLTWGITLAEKNGEQFSPVVYDRAKKSFEFLRTCMVEENGWLPNYGANDGALFFKLSNVHYRDYRPQLQALANALNINSGFSNEFEDSAWYGLRSYKNATPGLPANGIHSFTKGGYYIIREPETLTFIRCGSYKDRPLQADNLHVDVWYKGENILLDAGSYKYNTDEKTIRYFSGTQSHNTVMLGDYDQMLKGARFVWFNWSQCEAAKMSEHTKSYQFDGAISAFTYLNKNIVHKRTLIKQKGIPQWEITDEIAHAPAAIKMRQLWHMFPAVADKAHISAVDSDNHTLFPQVQDGWYSSLYGQKEKITELYFDSTTRTIRTTIIIPNENI